MLTNPPAAILPPTPTPRVWVEVTKAANKQGGPGWSLGECLFSPSRNKGGADTYSTLREVQKGDLVLHLVDGVFTGFSLAQDAYREQQTGSPQGGEWDSRPPYYRIDLERYEPFDRPLPLVSFLEAHENSIKEEIARDKPLYYPFVVQAGNLITRQGGYVSRCTERLYELIRLEVSVDSFDAVSGRSLASGTPARRYWALGAGEGGRLWGEFQEQKIAAIGWDAIGDLSQYKTYEAIREALAALRTEPNAPVPIMDAKACHDFVHVMKVGDFVVAKIGMKRALGLGIVESDYKFDPSRHEYKSVRDVRWVRVVNVEIPFRAQVPSKTLTDATNHPVFMEFVDENLVPPLAAPPPEPLPPYSIDDAIADGLFCPRAELQAIVAALRRKKNVILQAHPGVGKTFAARRLAYAIIGAKDPAKVEMVQFHQAYSYEDFVQGWRPTSIGSPGPRLAIQINYRV